MNYVIRNLSLVMLCFGLIACGESDSGTASAPAESAESAAAPMAKSTPAASGGGALSMDSIEKAEGVVYQDEIYANWPYN